MTDRRSMISNIEDALGSDGNTAIATAIFEKLRADGRITFSEQWGFRMAEIGCKEWLEVLQEVA